MKLFKWGLIISVCYLLLLAVLIYYLNLTLMSSWNELGDFLAGSFSPLAFLWLVLGYLQQQEELQQNTEALRLQAAELKNSVDQYKEMVSIAREQLLADAGLIEENKKIREIETKPDVRILSLAWQSKNGIEYTYKTHVHSDEREARNVCISFPNGFGNYKEFNRDLVKGAFQLPENKISISDVPMQVEVYISFESSIGKKYKYRYVYSDVEDGRYRKSDRMELVSD
ncbi:TPA: hypothetical protein MX399_004047 [Klebsiella quasipneumoniae]|nr:hypothetical protein [Klebsiella quasipneumoniae]